LPKANAESHSPNTSTLSRGRLGGKTMSFHKGWFKRSFALGIQIDPWGIGIDLVFFWVAIEWGKK